MTSRNPNFGRKFGVYDNGYDPVADVYSQPEEERLGYALELLKYFTSPLQDEHVRYLGKALNIDPTAARLLSHMKRFEGNIVPTERLYIILGWGVDTDIVNPRSNLSVCIHRLRKALPENVKLETFHGQGIRLEDPEDVITSVYEEARSVMEPPRLFENREWSTEEDELLLRMIRHEAQVAECSLVLRRSPRAVADRKNYLYKKFPDLFPPGFGGTWR